MSFSTNLPTIHALWIGDQLGSISSACLSSFVKQGHPVHLHTYNDIKDIPKGVTMCDANLIISKEKIIKHKATGSYALFSDIFRYELLSKVDGIYVDCDVYCLKPLAIPEHGYLYGFEDDHKINGAILAMPKNSLLLNQLLNIAYDEQFIPPWYSASKQNRLRWKKRFGFSRHISDMPWGAIGPDAITYYVKNLNMQHLAQPIDIFYPVHYTCINHLLEPTLDIHDVTSKRSLCVHLYNEMLRKVDLKTINANCILSNMLGNKI